MGKTAYRSVIPLNTPRRAATGAGEVELSNATDLATDGSPTLHRDGAIATIKLNRPRQHNRLDVPDLDSLTRLCDEAEADPAIRVILFTATGPSFSAGYDLSSAQGAARFTADSASDEAEDGEVVFARLCDRVEAIAKPTICAMNGSVYGGSTDLALACDFRIGVHGMQMRMPAAALGIRFYPTGLRRYVTRLGLGTAKRLFLTAETIGDQEMLRIGFLDQLVEADALNAVAGTLAGTLAQCAPIATQTTKQALNAVANGVLDDHAQLGAFRASLRGDEFAQALANWVQRRKG